MTYIESMTCMNCGTEIKRGYETSEEHTNILEQDWKGCSVDIQGGCSSGFDLDVFHGVICKPCLEKAMPNLFKVMSFEKPKPKHHYFPKGVNVIPEDAFYKEATLDDWIHIYKAIYDQANGEESPKPYRLSGSSSGSEGSHGEVSETGCLDEGEGSQAEKTI